MAHTQLIKLDLLEGILNTARRSLRPTSQPNFPNYTFYLIELLEDSQALSPGSNLTLRPYLTWIPILAFLSGFY
jgi:hypothetical protein